MSSATDPQPHDPSEPAGPEDMSDPLVASYRRLADVFHDVLAEQSLDDVLQRIADTLGELVPYDDITFYEADHDTRTLKAVYAVGLEEEQVLADPAFPFGVGLTGWAVERREPVLANRAELDPRVRVVGQTALDPESIVIVPLVARSTLKGTLNISRRGFHEFTEDEFMLCVRFGDAAALALDNAQIRASLERQAQTDSLTGLWNHRAFYDQLRDALAAAPSGPVGLVMLDLDDFKRINDVYGHDVGDTVLAELSEILRSNVRGTDIVSRVGGEEFALVLPGTDVHGAYRLAQRLWQRIRETTFERVGAVNLSVGVACGPLHAANPRELAACAELAMMTAKAAGKGRIVVFDEVESRRPEDLRAAASSEFRSVAHLRLLHAVSTRLNRLVSAGEIAEAVADELGKLIDYSHCHVYLREGAGLRELATRAGQPAAGQASGLASGIAARVVSTGQSFITGDATNVALGRQLEGAPRSEESLVAVALTRGADADGAIVIEQGGLERFDADDLRLLEVLAGHASVAFANARLYEDQRREADRAKAILELARELGALTDIDRVTEVLAHGAARLLGSPRASVWLPAPARGDLVCVAVADTQGPRDTRKWRMPPALVAAFSDRVQPWILEGAEAERVGRTLGLTAPLAPHAVAPLPLEGGTGFVAVEIDGAPGSFDLEMLGDIASQGRLAVSSAGNVAGIERTFLATVEALANAFDTTIDAASPHARQVSELALAVGQDLGLESAPLRRLELGALFHDIGKIGIPSAILTKPGPLTPEERAMIERHPELGERMLAPVEQLSDVRPIVRACHERFDGTGYPDGLAGQEIPIESRIIFVCDAFHAMTTDRPYRDALSHDIAIERLVDAAGTQFDPAVVDACVRALAARTDA